ncbi:MAG: RNA polymerase subunit sigma-24 [Planctomycetota bacterium]|nr:MAG: RNA polymerase subunit sigma-24 [Planctomycetota bacterium]REJ87576.1 MAG: RNA polymerase subunit sigma-24 [Planctomycetota bacterium]REK21410.1 MAG: RNA polymerase subunit sigma-24 [Planctomycetota bacterium]REK40079.1 MAG: RNA polymerase subunit sigma-24 [Planctomycetota bacterium]
MTTENEAELIDRAIHGDEEALALLFSAHRERLRRVVAFRLHPKLRSRVDPDDILQEAYLNAAQRLGRFLHDGAHSFFIWMRLILNQTLADVHRRHLGAQIRDARREARSRPASMGDSTSLSLTVHLIGHLTSPSQAALREELSEKIDDALSTMSELDQEVLAMRHFEELSNSEIAAALEISEQAAAMRYIRALGRIRDILVTIPGFGDE